MICVHYYGLNHHGNHSKKLILTWVTALCMYKNPNLHVSIATDLHVSIAIYKEFSFNNMYLLIRLNSSFRLIYKLLRQIMNER